MPESSLLTQSFLRKDSARSRRRRLLARLRLGRILPKLGLVLVASALLLELAARLLTSAPEDGLARFRRFTLLPYRPPRAAVERWSRGMDGARQIVRDPLLGWTIGASCEDPLYSSNAQHIRTRRERLFDSALPEERVRITTVGDSFTYSDDVALEAAWQTQLEALDPRLELLNFGVPGYGTDQALLRWRRDASPFASHIVLLGIWPENMCRNVNQNRFYLSLAPDFGFKPRFLLEAGELRLLAPPPSTSETLIAAFGDPLHSPWLQHERWLSQAELERPLWQESRGLTLAASLLHYKQRRDLRQRIYDGQDSEALELTAAIARAFAREVRQAGSLPIVMMFPMRDLLGAYGQAGSLPLTRELIAQGLDVLDLAPAFAHATQNAEASAYFQGGRAAGHLTEAGNALVARCLQDFLAARIQELGAGAQLVGR